ncbi:hypothetical protein F5B22DRAFT_632797 [Xylaria bambusicola]|uniref:uncharacterized protein n=1 Tax=Xylaria bambusicola TaxID=326684 RepID=UPI00200843F2|nr:uncharacterized protein F5B22DRAFT_632797 [Xylaria bambusicola]KAI0526264.1 hypothetical protein F5B22DRAFT_632797 [Xylaria bambusicola]
MPGEHTGPSVSPQTSPKTPGGSSPYQTSLRGGGDRQAENRALESTGTSQPNGENKQQFLPLRAFGVHNILNPAETQPSLARERGEEAGQSPKISSAASSSSPRIPPHFAYQESGMARRGQTTPTLEDQPLTAPSSAERGSPRTARPYPPLAAARRVLTPRSPRLMSPGHSHPLRALGPPQTHPQHLPGGPQDSNRAILPDTGASGQSDQALSTRGSPLAQQFNRVMSPTGRPPSSTTLPASTRSISQPAASHSTPGLQTRPFFPSGSGIQPGQPAGYPPHNPYSALAVSQTPAGYPAPSGESRWSGTTEHTTQYNSTGVRSFAFGEGQAAVRIQPLQGEPFIIPVDTQQGSRQADEKRQRNAGASQRFRKRKKDRETQERLEHQRMESQYRELEARIQTLENERERLRSDRDRLRDIVYRTPSVSELAYQGPPSPNPSNGSGPSPLGTMTAYGAADPDTGERSSQRRRTDPHPHIEFVTGPYGSAPGSLPPIAASGYPASMSHPGTPLARSQAPQLPPLRLGSAAGTPTTAVSASSTPIQTYQQLKREPYEMGWATGSRASADTSQR